MPINAITGTISLVLAQAQDTGMLTYLQMKFVEGGGFMYPILACLVLGLAFAFERFYTLTKANINAKKFLVQVKDAINKGGIEEATKLCQNSSGSIASVFHAGLLRAEEGLEAVEKSISAYGAIEMSMLEKGLIWISTFIMIAPLLGFSGTVQGMIVAFDSIKEAAQISPGVVAGGISVALLTTLFGLIVAMILQVCYNYFISRIDKIVADMEEASIELIDTLYDLNKNKK
ncbi:hypothetical protein APF79_07310 [bacterium BRH_c32]|nr:MAG: hypothetical protein APF79_07310 [bacterium BRH_c32]